MNTPNVAKTLPFGQASQRLPETVAGKLAQCRQRRGVVQSKTTATKKRPDFQALRGEGVAEVPEGKEILI